MTDPDAPTPAAGPTGNGDAGPMTLSVEAPRRMDQVADLVERVEAFLAARAVPEEHARRLTVSIDELVTNVVKYGSLGFESAPVRVSVTIQPGVVRVLIQHAGGAFDPFTEVPPPDFSLPLERRPIGGLGVWLVKSLMTSARYERVGNDNRITLTRSLDEVSREENP